MNVYRILSIEPTRDEEQIRQAYLARLPQFHPEDDPQGFQQLREAYEEAIRLCREKEEAAEDRTPTGLILQSFQQVYENFADRIRPAAWQTVLDQDLCRQIDTQREVEEKLLVFLLDHYFIPRNVWQLLSDFFCWEEMQEALRDRFPSDFINFLLDSCRREDLLRYEFFRPDSPAPFDAFIENCYAINNALNNGDLERIPGLLSETDAMGIEHPDYTLLKLRHLVLTEAGESAMPPAERLIADWPEDMRVQHGVAQTFLQNGKAQQAKALFEKVLTAAPKHYSARVGLAGCVFATGDLPQAKELYREILLEFPYDIYVRNAFYDTNEKLISIYETALTETPGKQELIYKLASCYYNCGQYESCIDLLKDVDPEPENLAKHYDIYGVALLEMGQNEEALAYLLVWETHETERIRIAQQLPAVLLSLDQLEASLAECEKYLAEFPGEPRLYDTKASILRRQGDVDGALEVLNRGIEADSRAMTLYAQKAEICQERGDYAEALDNAELALQIYPCMYPMLLLKMKIFHEASAHEEVLNICRQVDEYGIQDPQTDLYRSLARLALDQEATSALAFLLEFLKTEPASPAALYAVKEYYEDRRQYEIALHWLNQAAKADPGNPWIRLDMARNLKWQGNIAAAFEVLEWFEEHPELELPDLYNEKGLLYLAEGSLKLAEIAFKNALELNETDSRAWGNLADVYTQNGEFEKALESYTKQLAVREHPYYYLSRGLTYSALGRTAEEKEDYRKAIELTPDYAFAWNNLGVACYEEDLFDEALCHFDEALRLDPALTASHQYRAKALTALSRHGEALAGIDQGIAHLADAPHALSILYQEKTSLLRDLSRYRDAADLAELVDTFAFENAEIFRNLAYCFYELREDETAERYYQKAAALSPNSAAVWHSIGHFYSWGKIDRQKAIEAFERAVELDDTYYNHVLELALAHQRAGNRTAFERHLNKALHMLTAALASPQVRPCEHYHMGECLLALGDCEKALKHLQAAIDAAPDYAHCTERCCYEACYCLARLFEETGDLTQAAEYYERTVAIMSDREYVAGLEAFRARRKK